MFDKGSFWAQMAAPAPQGGDFGMKNAGSSLSGGMQKRQQADKMQQQQAAQGMAAGQGANRGAMTAGQPKPQMAPQQPGTPQLSALPSMVPPPAPAQTPGGIAGAGLGGAATVQPTRPMFGGPGPSAPQYSGINMGMKPPPNAGMGIGGAAAMSDERAKNAEITSLRKRYAALGGR